MKRNTKRVLTLLLALVLCLGLLPVAAFAEEEPQESYTITFDANGGAFPGGSTSWTTKTEWMGAGNNIKEEPPVPEWESGEYVFDGWDAETENSIGNVDFTASVTVKAKWRANSNVPVLKLDPNGGTCSKESVKLDTSGTAPTLKEELPTPTRPGYAFDGWYLADFSRKVAVGDAFSGGETIRAKWIKTRTSKTTPSLTASPAKIGVGKNKIEIVLSCASSGVALDWRPLERALYSGGEPYYWAEAAKGLLSGNFSDVGLQLTKVDYQDLKGGCNEDAYPPELYPEGVCPAAGLVLTLEGSAKAGTLTIQLSGKNFLELVPEGDGTVLDAASADIFNTAQVKIPVGSTNPNGPYIVTFDLNYKDPKKSEIPKEQKITKGYTVNLPDGKKLTCPFLSHEFYAWCLMGEDGKLYPWKDGTPVTADMTLYAGWIRKGTAVKEGQALPEAAEPVQTPPVPPAPSTPAVAQPKFSDVAASSPFAAAISWAVEKKITNGKTATTFGPGDPCTRAQIVTFLWRAAGSPEPKTMEAEYADVTNTAAYYYKAVQWAAEMGMEESGTFAPHDTCTRVTAVYFIWTAFGSPKAAAKASFEDVQEPERGQWYWPDLPDAVDWAVETGVTTGKTATTFGPGDPCTRGQIVTFLYRAYVK